MQNVLVMVLGHGREASTVRGTAGRAFQQVSPVRGTAGRAFQQVSLVRGTAGRAFQQVTPVRGTAGRTRSAHKILARNPCTRSAHGIRAKMQAHLRDPMPRPTAMSATGTEENVQAAPVHKTFMS